MKKNNRGSKLPVAVRHAPGAIAAGHAAAGDGDWIVAAVCGLFLVLLLLACSPALDSKFALPKMLVLRAAMLALGAFVFVQSWRGLVLAPPRAPLLAALALGAWWTATTPFALHVPTALDGVYDYYNGLWMHLCWLVLFVASLAVRADGVTLRRIVGVLLAAIALVAAVNLSEAARLSAFGLAEVSTLGDRVAVSALMNFAIPFAVIALLRARSWTGRAGLAGLLALLLVSAIVSQGRGPWLGLVVALVILVMGLARSAAAWLLIAAALAGSAIVAALTAMLNPAMAQRFASLADVAHDENVRQRFVYYKAALRATLDHPLTGIGFENFQNSYPLYRTADPNFFNNIIPTMVHNGYLEQALNNGIVSLLLYLLLLAVVLAALLGALRREPDRGRKDLLLGFLAVLAAYLVQDLTGWLDIGVASVFWITLGLAANLAGQGAAQRTRPWSKPLLVAGSAIVVVLSLYLLRDAGLRLAADASLAQAQALDVRTQWPQSEALARTALSSMPTDARTELIAGQLYARRYQATRDPQALSRANELLQASYRHNPFERLRLFNVVHLEALALEWGQIAEPSEFARNAIPLLAKTDWDNSGMHETNARFQAAQGRFAQALMAIRKARELAPQEARLRARELEYEARMGR